VLADEINRATPKTQSALLEAMQEQAVTIAGQRHALEAPFFVLATENPIEMEGTYPLPEAQLDRFLLKVIVPAPSHDELTAILERTTGQPPAMPGRVLSQSEVLELCALCRDIAVAEPVLRYAARLVGQSSPDAAGATPLVRRAVRFGAGVRGAQSLILAAKAVALVEGRGHVSFADVQRTARPVLRHRILRSFEGEADGVTTDQIVDELSASVPTLPEAVERAVKQ
jgi:MoxR-like ATPase